MDGKPLEDTQLDTQLSNLVGIALTEMADVVDVLRLIVLDATPPYKAEIKISLEQIEASIKRARIIGEYLRGVSK